MSGISKRLTCRVGLRDELVTEEREDNRDPAEIQPAQATVLEALKPGPRDTNGAGELGL